MTWWLQDVGLPPWTLAAQLATLFAQVPALRERALTFKGDCQRSKRSSKAAAPGQALSQGRQSLSNASLSCRETCTCLFRGQFWWHQTCASDFVSPSNPACAGCRCPCHACQPVQVADGAGPPSPELP